MVLGHRVTVRRIVLLMTVGGRHAVYLRRAAASAGERPGWPCASAGERPAWPCAFAGEGPAWPCASAGPDTRAGSGASARLLRQRGVLRLLPRIGRLGCPVCHRAVRRPGHVHRPSHRRGPGHLRRPGRPGCFHGFGCGRRHQPARRFVARRRRGRPRRSLIPARLVGVWRRRRNKMDERGSAERRPVLVWGGTLRLRLGCA